MACGAESLAVALGCGLGLWAVCILEGQAGAVRWAAVGIGSLAAGLAWWLAQRPQRALIARRIDHELGLGGEFLTAYQAQAQRSEAAGGVLELLAQRAMAGLRWRDVRRAALPHSLACAAAPFAGAALLAGALQVARASAAAPTWTRAVSEDLLTELALARKEAFASGTLEDGAVDGVAGLVDAARAALEEAGLVGEPEQGDPASGMQALQELRDELEQVALVVQADPNVDPFLDQAAADLDALLSRPAFQNEAEPGGEAWEAQPRTRAEEASRSAVAGSPGETSASPPAGAEPGTEGRGGASKGRSEGQSGDSYPEQEGPLAPGTPSSGPAGQQRAGLDWVSILPPHRRSLAQRWLERRSAKR